MESVSKPEGGGISGPRLGWAVRIVLLVIGAAPVVSPLVRDVPGLSNIAELFESWFAFQCHREEARSLTLWGHLLPVCSRCWGIYLGLGLGALVLRPRVGVLGLRLWVGLAAAVMILDVWSENLGMRAEFWPLRLVTGVALSYPVAVALVLAAHGQLEDDQKGPPLE